MRYAMLLESMIEKIKKQPDDVRFGDLIATIDAFYHYSPVHFTNGLGDDALLNAAGMNQGSCKIFAFALIHKLTEQETLSCFGEHYREVLTDPQGAKHANIRRFMQDGWQGVRFDQMPLLRK